MVDIKVYNCYSGNGKSFEELLTEGIKQANLEAIHKQIITLNTTSDKEVSQ